MAYTYWPKQKKKKDNFLIYYLASSSSTTATLNDVLKAHTWFVRYKRSPFKIQVPTQPCCLLRTSAKISVDFSNLHTPPSCTSHPLLLLLLLLTHSLSLNGSGCGHTSHSEHPFVPRPWICSWQGTEAVKASNFRFQGVRIWREQVPPSWLQKLQDQC